MNPIDPMLDTMAPLHLRSLPSAVNPETPNQENNAVGQGFEISGVKSAFLTGIFVLKGTFFVP